MPVKTFRPLTPSTRYIAYADFSDITKAKPEKSLVEIRKRTGGRNVYGRMTARGIGGGHNQKIRLVDFKMETGRLWENDLMRIVVADEISPDSCRLWDIKSNEKLDKDRFRRDLGGVLEAYTEVAKRLGILAENERPMGTGPVLVKS